MKKQTQSQRCPWLRTLTFPALLGLPLVALFGAEPNPAPAQATAHAQTNAPTQAATQAPPAAQPPAPAQPATPPAQTNLPRNIRFQFDGMPYQEALERFSQMAGKPLVIETNLEGTITFSDPTPYTYAEALDTLNLILSMKHAMLVEADRYLRLVPLSKLPQMPLKIFRGLDQTGDVRPGEIVTIVLELKHLDAGEVAAATTPMLSPGGSLAPLTRGRGLVVTDKLQSIQRIRQLLAQLDTEAHVQRQMRTFSLLHASGALVADLLNRTFGMASAPKRLVFNEQAKRYDELSPDPNDYVTAVFDEASRTLVLFGPRDRIGLAEELIQRFEEKAGGKGGDVRIYYGQVVQAEELANMIRQAIPGVAAPNETAASAATKARVIVDRPLNRVIVAAPIAGQLDAIDQLVQKVDRSATAESLSSPFRDPQLTRVFRPKFVEATTAVQVLTNALSKLTPTGLLVSRVHITLDPASQSLVVTGSSEDLKQAQDILQQLEALPDPPQPRRLAILELQHAKIDAVLSSITNLVQEKLSDPRFRDAPKPSLVPDPAHNRLLVTATESQFAIISEVVKVLDEPGDQTKRQLVLLPLEAKSAPEILPLLNQVLAQSTEFPGPQEQRPTLMADPSGKQLLALVLPKDLDRLRALVRQFDTSAATAAPRELRAVALHRRSATEFTTLVQQLYDEQTKGLPEPQGGRASIVAEKRGNRLMVSGSAKEIARVEAIVRQLDPTDPAAIKDETRVLRLKTAVATEVVDLVDKSLNAQRDQVKVLVDARSNALVVTGEPAAVEAAAQLIQQLDTKPTLQPREMRVVELRAADAATISPILNDLFLQIMREERGPQYTSPTRIVPDTAANRLILTGPQDELQQVTTLVAQMDQPPVQAPGARVFPLKAADAVTLAPVVSNAMTRFDTQGRAIPRAVVAADEKSNSLIVTGARTDVQEAGALIQSLDTPSTSRSRLFHLFDVAAEDPAQLATLATQAFVAYNQGRPATEAVTITVDPNGKRLIVLAPSPILPQVTNLLAALDQKPGTPGRQLHLLDLQHGRADELLPMVQRVYTEQASAQPGKSATLFADPSGTHLGVIGTPAQADAIRAIAASLEQFKPAALPRATRVFLLGNPAETDRLLTMLQQLYQDRWKEKPKSDPPDAQILGDNRAGRLIVSGRPEHLKAIESLLTELATTQVSVQPLDTRVYDLKASSAATLATTLQTLYQEQLKTRTDLPSVQTLILPDAVANRLIIAGASNELNRVEALLQKLDKEGQSGPVDVRVFNLKNGRVQENATVVRQLLQSVNPALRLRNPSIALPEPIVTTDDRGNSLIISGGAPHFALMDHILPILDRVPDLPPRDIQVFWLKNARASEVASRVDMLFGDRPRTERPYLEVDSSANSLTLIGKRADFAEIEQIILRLDAAALEDTVQVRLVRIDRIPVEQMAKMLQNLYPQMHRGQLRFVEKLTPPPPSTNTTSFPTNAPAPSAVIATNVPEVAIVIDRSANSLLLSGPARELDRIDQMISELSRNLIGADAEFRQFVLKFADPASVAKTLGDLFRFQGQRGGGGQQDAGEALPPSRISVVAEPRSRSVIVRARPADFTVVESLLAQLDVEGLRPQIEHRVVYLTNSTPDRLAPLLTQMITQFRTLQPGDPISFIPDERSRSILLVAHEATLKNLEALIRDLDIPTPFQDLEVRFVALKKSSAAALATLLQNILRPSPQGILTSEARDLQEQVRRLKIVNGQGQPIVLDLTKPIKIMADAPVPGQAGGNHLILFSTADNLKALVAVTEMMDGFPLAGGLESVRIYPLKFADAARLQRVLSDLFDPTKVPQLRPEDRPIITIDERTNALIVSGNPTALAFIDSLITRLDNAEVADRTGFRVFPLKNATAGKLQDTLQRLLANRPPRIRGQAADPITVVGDPVGNSLLVAASPEDMVLVASLIERLDTLPTEPATEFDILPLNKADARRVADTIENLYRGTTATTGPIPVAIQTDERLNALVVSAGDADRKRIRELVAKLDTDAVGRVSEIRVIPLQYARAEALSTLLNSALNTRPEAAGGQSPNTQSLLQFITRLENGQDLITAALKERVTITPDPRMNSLIVSGPLDYIPLLDQIVKRLDAESPQLAQIKVFTLTNADARALSDVLSTLFHLRPLPGQAASQRSVQYTLVKPAQDPENPEAPDVPGAAATFGTAEEHSLTITVDPRTNSLLVGGADNYVKLATEIIQTLDASPVQERQTEVYRLRNSRAPDVQTALRTFLEQDRLRITQVLGPNAVGAAERLLEREVAIVAEQISNSLLISANPRYFTEIKGLIEELDQPQPQVLIQALIAEVLLNNTTEIGVEWTYNTTDGSRTYGVGTDFGVADALQKFGGFSTAVTGSDYTFLLRALETDNRVQVLSRPQILTADNQPATINVGQRVPLITNSRVTDNDATINSIEYRNVGVILTVIPRISPDGFVRMDVGTTNSSLSSSTVTISQGVDAPIINERLATTTVAVRSGQSIIIGGLISTTDDSLVKKVPLLGDIPLLGYLFRTSSKIKDRKELLIFLTPQVLVKLDDEHGTTTDAKTLTREQIQKSGMTDKIKADLLKEDGKDLTVPPSERPHPDSRRFR